MCVHENVCVCGDRDHKQINTNYLIKRNVEVIYAVYRVDFIISYLPSKRMFFLFQKSINLFGFVALLQLLGRAAQPHQVGEKVAAAAHAGESRRLQSTSLATQSFCPI